ncbi:MAG TPA: sigma-70 family RNA polymerase sigma factor [Puia sp.]|jgi:RNA polymerase sigma-70 factor (ECF subfamily)|nr:sigma-70 family RNA polymerase sigma factor [Puia sp.]
MPEPEILHRLSTGDHSAFTYLYNLYQPLITRVLFPFNPPIEPPEIVQDIFYKVWLKKELMPGVRSFKSYLLRMVRNRLIDKNKAFKIQATHQRSYATLKRDEHHSGPDDIYYNELRDQTKKAISQLPERQRKILELTLLDDYSRDEIAGIMNVSVWVVDKDLGQATRTVRDLIAAYGQERS